MAGSLGLFPCEVPPAGFESPHTAPEGVISNCPIVRSTCANASHPPRVLSFSRAPSHVVPPQPLVAVHAPRHPAWVGISLAADLCLYLR